MRESTGKNKADSVLTLVKKALSNGEWHQAISYLEELRPQDQAGVFVDLQTQDQLELLPLLDPEDSANILEAMEDEDAADVAILLGTSKLADILNYMEPDEAADILGDIQPEKAAVVLASLEDAPEIKPLMAHKDDTAGGLMTSIEVTLQKEMSAQQAIEHLRKIAPDSEVIYYLFIVDDAQHLVGVVSLRQLIITSPDTRIEAIMEKDLIYINVDADQEEAASLLTKYDLLALPVVDPDMKLLGLITYDDCADVLVDEATEDIYRLGGVPQGQPAVVSVPGAIKNRLPWLTLNMATALISATVLSSFEKTITQVATLAAFFPIVAGVSGSAGTQTLTVTVRGLALGKIDLRDGMKTILKETVIGFFNGLALGLTVLAIALIWKGNPYLGLVVGLASLLNLITAGIAGAVVPLIFQFLKIDPALASPILVTTTTDTLGYLYYLGIATLLITWLV